MRKFLETLIEIKNIIKKSLKVLNRKEEDITLIAVSKQQPEEKILKSLNSGHRVFGENRVQEAKLRWEKKKNTYKDLVLHLIGPLQSNKTADAVKIFNFIHTVDREKIASSLSYEMQKQNKEIPCFIQINTGSEKQKSGIKPYELKDFLDFCSFETKLKIIGLMCIPPVEDEATLHFGLLKNLANKNNLNNLSMGMSSDYEVALHLGATHLRIGSAIFGNRK
tara:strand:+ start:90 stop:755 length:666 start_codon:yes stop_codon:yes gene_type:complete